MIERIPFVFALLAAMGMTVLLSACASPAERTSMEVTPTASARQKNDYSVAVTVRGGRETGALSSSDISNADFKGAIESSLAKAGVFQTVQQGPGAQYELSAAIVELSKPVIGISFTVHLEVAWTLTRAKDKVAIVRKAIRTTHTAGGGEAFAGATRLRLAVEGAARKNIEAVIQEIANSAF